MLTLIILTPTSTLTILFLVSLCQIKLAYFLKTLFRRLLFTELSLGFPGGPVVKNLPAMQKTWVRSLGWKDLLEEGMATHSSTFEWRIPWAEEPGGLSP